MKREKRRFQRRIPGVVREPLPSCVIDEIRERVQKLAIRFNCSKSFVISTLLAEALDIFIEERFYAIDEGRRKGGSEKATRRQRKREGTFVEALRRNKYGRSERVH